MFKEKSEKEARNEILFSIKEYYNNYVAASEPSPDRYLNYSGRVYDSFEMIALVDSSLDFWLTAGRFADSFEKSFSEFIGARYCSLVNSGSSANLLAFMTLTSPLIDETRRIKHGDEVITVAAGFPTTVAPIVQYGAIPVFVDVTVPQYNIDVNMLESAYSSKSKAVFIAHTLGNPFDIDAVKSFCDKRGLWLIEDNCDALGSKYTMNGETRFTGIFGDIGTSSFYPPHHITMGEGGAVYTSNPLLHKIIRSLRDWGRDCVCPSGRDNLCGNRFSNQYGSLPPGYDHKYVYSHLGYNLKATDMQAAIGTAQLKKLPGFIETRRRNFDLLKKSLSSISDKVILPEVCENSEPSWFGFMLTCRDGFNRDQIVTEVEKSGVQTRALFAGNLIKHPCFSGLRENVDYRVVGLLKQTDIIMERSFWVGVYPGMNERDMDRIARAIIKAVNLQ